MHATLPRLTQTPPQSKTPRRAASRPARAAAPSLLPAFAAASARGRKAWLPWALSAAAHLAVICGGPFWLLHRQDALFAIDAGKNSIELDLVAAPREAVQAPMEPVVEPPVVQEPEPKLDPIVQKVEPPKPEVKPEPPQPPQPEKGDGSAPQPGKAATTLHSDAGALREAKPDYLRNPPPAYPESARRARQEGLVRLLVVVGAEGRPESVDLAAGSGCEALDQAAVKAVREWRFRPATEGGAPVRSRVSVPVRFRLEQ